MIRRLLARLSAIFDRDDAHPAFQSGFGIRDASATMAVDPVALDSALSEAMGLPKPRCESRKREGTRSWRCTKDAGHKPTTSDGGHFNIGGGRRW